MGAAALDDSVFVSERICIACEAGFLILRRHILRFIDISSKIDDSSPESWCHRVGDNELILAILEALFRSAS